MPEPEQYRVDLAYRLASLAGRSAGTQSKTWFFDDFSELVLYRAMAAGRVTDEQARKFLTKLYPGNGDSVFADRRDRMANLVTVRPATAFRRAPGSRPYASGPV
jgi:hypothetical protein